MAEEWTRQEELEYLSGAVAAHRTLNIAFIGMLMTIGGITMDEMSVILQDFMGAVAFDSQHPKFGIGEREELSKIANALERMKELRGL